MARQFKPRPGKAMTWAPSCVFVVGSMVGSVSALAEQSVAPLRFDPSQCVIRQTVAPDVDVYFVESTRPESDLPLPAAVETSLRRASAKLLAGVTDEGALALTCEAFFIRTYNVTMPANRQLFVSAIGLPHDKAFFLMVHDPATGQATEEPPMVNARWLGQIGEALNTSFSITQSPVVSFVDLRQDGHTQIAVERQGHNGNGYNNIRYHYFDVGPNLDLIHVLVRETRIPSTEAPSAGNDGRETMMDREIEILGRGRIRLETFLVAEGASRTKTSLGYAVLESSGLGKPFLILEQHPTSQNNACNLIFTDECRIDPNFMGPWENASY